MTKQTELSESLFDNVVNHTELPFCDVEISDVSKIIYDAETFQLPDEVLDELYIRPDESEIKYGNAKKPEARERARTNWLRDHAFKFRDKAALSPRTGCVIALGALVVMNDGNLRPFIISGAEKNTIEKFWTTFCHAKSQGVRMLGWNSHHFDIPFMIRRSYAWGVDIPEPAFNMRGNRLFLDDTFVDIKDRWTLGIWEDRFESIDSVALALGLPGKSQDVTGKDFGRLFLSKDTAQRKRATDYLINDLKTTYDVAEKLGA